MPVTIVQSTNDQPFTATHREVLKGLISAQICYDPRPIPDGGQPITWTFATNQKSVRYWFAYFWPEAKAARGGWDEPAFLTPLLEFFNGNFKLPNIWNAQAPQPLPAGDNGNVLALKPGGWSDDQLTLKALSALMDRGMEHTGHIPTQIDPAPNLTAWMVELPPNTVKVGWRGENRSRDQIVNAGGFTAKARSEIYAKRLNVWAAWNPLSIPARRDAMWYRTGNTDNDKYTVVSATPLANAAACFPRIDVDIKVGNQTMADWLAGHQIAGNDAMVNMQAYQNQDVRWLVSGRANNQSEILYLYVDRVTLYLCAITGWYFDTNKKQGDGGFPEFGVEKIPVESIVGHIRFMRVFHGDNDNDGFTLLIDTTHMPNQNDMAPNVLQAERQASALDRSSFRWEPTGPTAVEGLRVRDNAFQIIAMAPPLSAEPEVLPWPRQ